MSRRRISAIERRKEMMGFSGRSPRKEPDVPSKKENWSNERLRNFIKSWHGEIVYDELVDGTRLIEVEWRDKSKVPFDKVADNWIVYRDNDEDRPSHSSFEKKHD